MAQLEARYLRRLLFDILNPTAFEGENPYLVSLGDAKYWIYLKNLSPAYFKNPDVWRAQLPIRDIFNTCKESSYPFILLGYDDENDVYATWNPNFTKQRLNEAESVSFYSRLSLQKEACDEKDLLHLVLQNDIKVICFPRSKVLEVINSIDSFFSEDSTEYVAVGSKRRTDANSTYRDFTDIQNIEPFFNYLLNDNGYSEKTATNYSQAIKRFIAKGYFSKYRTLLLKYDVINDYTNAFDEFFSKEDIHILNENSRRIHSNAFMRYIDFLCKKNGITLESKENSNINDQTDSGQPINWEAAYTDKNGKLTKIANPELLDLLRPVLDTDFPSTMSALNIISEFYADTFSQDVMEIKDWVNLIHNVEWDLTNSNSSNIQQHKSSAQSQGGKEYTLCVTYPDGTQLRNSNNTTTFLQIINENYPDLIMGMGIMVNGINLITSHKIKPRQKKISSGYYVDVNYKTEKKAEILEQISKELELGLNIELLPFESNSVTNNSNSTHSENSLERAKIKVTLPNGDTIFHKKVVETYCQTIEYVGVERILQANIFIGNNPLIIQTYNSSLKYRTLSNGYSVHVNSSTTRKFGILNQINELFNVGLTIDFVDSDMVVSPSKNQIDIVSSKKVILKV